MNKVYVTEKETLQRLYEDSALTIEGLTEESIPDFVEWIEQHTELNSDYSVYIVKGSMMNESYSLTGDNRYPDNCNIVAVLLSDMKDPSKIVLPRFSIGGRWFDDIVHNNAMREGE